MNHAQTLERLFEMMMVDCTDRYALAQLHALSHSPDRDVRQGALETLAQFGVLLIQNSSIPVNGVRVGDRINHRRTAMSAGEFKVLDIQSVYGGNISFNVEGFSEQGAVIHTSLVYRPDQEVEIER